jgi:hypothetical protein
MSTSDLGQLIEQYHRALDAFVQGDPEPVQQLFSRRDNVTLANPLGPAVRGLEPGRGGHRSGRFSGPRG